MKKQIVGNEGDSAVMEEMPGGKTANETIERADIQSEQKDIVESQKTKAETSGYSAGDEARQHPEWNRLPHFRKSKHLIAGVIAASDLMVFEMLSDHHVVKNNWMNLPTRLQEVFEEIIYSLPLNKLSDHDDDGCYTFSYSDEEFELSVISIVIKGKAALFYKNLKHAVSL